MQRNVQRGIRYGTSKVHPDKALPRFTQTVRHLQYSLRQSTSKVHPVGEECKPRRYISVYDRDRFRSVHEPPSPVVYTKLLERLDRVVLVLSATRRRYVAYC